jgi:hypothetical protein
MVITLVSEDKVSLSMFLDFYRTLYDSGVEVLDLNSLVGGDVINQIVRTFIGTHLNRSASDCAAVIIKVKTKKDTGLENLPEEVQRKSDYILKFIPTQARPEALKSKNPALFDSILDRYAANLKN